MPAYHILKNTDFVSLKIEPNEQDQRGKKIRCQHGSKECKADSYVQCSISSYPEPENYLRILDCSFKRLLKSDSPNAVRIIAPNEQVEAAFSTCAIDNGLDFRPIQACYKNEEKVVQLDVSMYTPVDRNCVPRVEINDRPIHETRSLIEEICKAYDGNDPNEHCAKYNIKTAVKNRKYMMRYL